MCRLSPRRRASVRYTRSCWLRSNLARRSSAELRPQSIVPHQPLDPVKPAGKPFPKNIAPHAGGRIGPVAGFEARLDRPGEPCVMDLASAGRAKEPGMEARARDLRRLAEPADGPDMAVFGNGGESHIASRTKKAAAFFRMSRSACSRVTYFFSAAISVRSAWICPFPGNAVAGAVVCSRIRSAARL